MNKIATQELVNRLFEQIKDVRILDLMAVKNLYRELHPGGCGMLSQGLNCKCFLCIVDNMIAEIKKSDDL